MPTFCRHNRLIQNCPICSREQEIDLRPLVSPSAPRTTHEHVGATRPRGAARSTSPRSAPGVTVRRLARGADDGYSCRVLPGLRSSVDAERLAEELAFAATRLAVLEHDAPGLYAEVASPGGDLEERTWLAFLISYLAPLESDDPFSSIRAARTPWASEEEPQLSDVLSGPRTAHDPQRGLRTVNAYRAWVQRAGSQAAAFSGESGWNRERRFARLFERLALPGLHRDARFDLLVTLGRLGLYDVRADSLHLGGDNEVTLAAKRALGIGDPLLLERRAAELAGACKVPLEALDLGLYNWGRGVRATVGLGPGAEPDADVQAAVCAGLGL